MNDTVRLINDTVFTRHAARDMLLDRSVVDTRVMHDHDMRWREGCAAGIQDPPLIQDAFMWVSKGEEEVLEKVGVWVICCGIQADGPMRALLSRSLGAVAERACDCCGLVGKKGTWNATKFLGYVKPQLADIRDPLTGVVTAECKAYATGKVMPQTVKKRVGVPSTRTPDSMHLTGVQMRARDRDVDTESAVITARIRTGLSVKQAESKKEALYKTAGSKGESEHSRSGLGYWDVKKMSPWAVYHCLYLGIAKDFISWFLVRLGETPGPQQEAVLCFTRPRDVKRLLKARRAHFVLRDKPDCIMVDFTAYSNSMSMSEMQLLYEVGVPYMCHDLAAFGVPQMVVVMWLLLRHGMIIFTRLPEETSKEDYKQLLYEGRAALFAYAAIAEFFHSRDPSHISQFKFTWKLHVSVSHLAQLMLDYGHAVQANDSWVERLLRHKASTSIKCDFPRGDAPNT
jgi:hypothetical protein